MSRRAAARAVLLLACVPASLYALLCHIPFTWNNFVADRRYPAWVGLYLAAHGAIAAAAAIAGAWALAGRARAAWAAAAALALAALGRAGGLGALAHGDAALAAALAAPGAYALWELLAGPDEPAPERGPVPPLAPAAAALLAAFAGWLGALAAAGRPESWALAGAALARSALAHAALFLAAGLLADAALVLPPRARAATRAGAAWTAAAWVVLVWVLGALDFRGPRAWACAAVLGGALALALARARPGGAARAAAARTPVFLLALAALALVPAAAHRALRGGDWNRLLETLATLGVWAAAWALFAARGPATAPPEAFRRRAAAAVAVLALAWSGEAAARLLDGRLRARLILLPEATASFAGRDPSFSAARRAVGAAGRDDYYGRLRARTNLRAGSVTPRTVSFSDAPLAPPPGARLPHLIVIVVDSLRRDKLGAYEPSARLTPHLDAFAREADAFRGFTPYGGTALSEPAIWSGAFLPHLQYPAPFAPLNALEALARGLGYRPLVTVDVVLSRLLTPGWAAGGLDEATKGNYKLCATLAELEGRLDAELASGRPLFAYTQPQDIHISVLAKERRRYDEALGALDACFGRFVGTLKAKGLYDESAIVVTADHGDSLGEGGRWGHAYTLFPEIVKIPLLVRLPPRLRAGLSADLEAPAFLTDLVPSLHAALGLPYAPRPDPLGRSLYARSPAELAATRREERLLASSYGPVWGVLGGGGAWLFVADAVEFKSYWYDLANDPRGSVNALDPEKEARGRAALERLAASAGAFHGEGSF